MINWPPLVFPMTLAAQAGTDLNVQTLRKLLAKKKSQHAEQVQNYQSQFQKTPVPPKQEDSCDGDAGAAKISGVKAEVKALRDALEEKISGVSGGKISGVKAERDAGGGKISVVKAEGDAGGGKISVVKAEGDAGGAKISVAKAGGDAGGAKRAAAKAGGLKRISAPNVKPTKSC